MPLFFTKSNLIYDHPLNKDWIDLHYMTDVELTQWWNKLCKLLIEDYEKNGMPQERVLMKRKYTSNFIRQFHMTLKSRYQ
jgi:hypothetical protein